MTTLIGLMVVLASMAWVRDPVAGDPPAGEEPPVALDDLLAGADDAPERFRAFCRGGGVGMIGAPRRMRPEELALCASQGIVAVDQALVGYDALVLAQLDGLGAFDVELRELFLASAALVPDGPGCELIPNPNRSWSDVAPDMPSRAIRLYGWPTGGAAEARWIDRALLDGARQIDCLAALEREDPDAFARAIMPRQDEIWLDEEEGRDPLARLMQQQGAVGLLGWQQFRQIPGLAPLSLGGVVPSGRTVGGGSYPLAEPLYLYTGQGGFAEPSARRVLRAVNGPGPLRAIRVYTAGSRADEPLSVVSDTDGRRVRTYSTSPGQP